MNAIPFTLKLNGMLMKHDQVEMKTVVNKETNEQLSFSQPNRGMIEIKRTRAPEEKKKNSKTVRIEALFDNKQ